MRPNDTGSRDRQIHIADSATKDEDEDDEYGYQMLNLSNMQKTEEEI